MTAHVVLDWRDRAHWSADRRPCTWCGDPTSLRDAGGRASHKVCAGARITERRELRQPVRTRGAAS